MKLQKLAFASVGMMLAALIVAPTPGSVGSCSEDTTLANAPQFCADKFYWSYQRAFARGEATEEETQNNIAGIPELCNSAVFVDCNPTQLVADACINALKDAARLSEPTESIAECQDSSLCANGGGI